jgi:signal transduction histidine kinase
MARAVERMRSLIDDLLLLAEVADPDTVPDVRPVDLTAVVTEALDLLSVTIDQKRLRVLVHLPPAPVRVLGGPHELFQLCANLVSNAVKYTPMDGTIAVSLDGSAGDVQLVVADTGIGISESDQHRLFDEFFRSTNPAALTSPGTGLGLSIVHRIVERHHGRITVDSHLDAGTTFTVTLPAATDQSG